jgi:hypothetical protein
MPDDQQSQGNGQQQATDNATGQQGGNASAGNGGQGNDDKKFSQAELEAHIKARLDQANRAAETKAQREREAAEAEALKEQQKFKELAEQRERQLAEIEPFKAKAERYEAALTTMLETECKGLPAHITALLDKLDPAEQLEWIATNRDALGQATDDAANGSRTATRAVPTTPRPNAKPQSRDERIQQARQELKRTGAYAPL